MKNIIESLWCLCLIVCCIASAKETVAGPLTGPRWDIDTPTFGLAAFNHGEVAPGAVPHQVGPFTSPSGFWQVRFLRITELTAGNVDSVTISGTFQHIKGPHAGEGEGPIFSFSFLFNASQGDGSAAFGPAANRHLQSDHVDTFIASVAWTTSPDKTRITGFSLGLLGEHAAIPEPATMRLVGTGLLGMVTLARIRKRKRVEWAQMNESFKH